MTSSNLSDPLIVGDRAKLMKVVEKAADRLVDRLRHLGSIPSNRDFQSFDVTIKDIGRKGE